MSGIAGRPSVHVSASTGLPGPETTLAGFNFRKHRREDVTLVGRMCRIVAGRGCVRSRIDVVTGGVTVVCGDSMKYIDFGLTSMTFDHDRVRSDGGIDALDSPPRDVMDEEALKPETLARNAPRLETVVQLLNNPALTRVYVYVCYWGPVAPPEIMEALDISKSTTYEYVDRLVDLGLVDRDDSTRPQKLTADPIVIVEQYAPIVITPTVLHALALQEVDEDIAYFIDRYGIGKLIAALRGAGLHFAGKTTQRMVAADIDVRETEATMIIYALKPALAVGRDHDPFFEYLFPDVDDEMDLPDLEEISDAPTHSSDLDR